MSLLGIDLGTTVCKAAVFRPDGECLALASREYVTSHPEPGWNELNGSDVWGKTREIIAEVVAKSLRDPVTAICIGSMGEALVPLTRNRRILGSSILSSDSRGGEYAAALEKSFGQESFYKINPNWIGPQFSLPKLLWLRDHAPRQFEEAELWMPWGDTAAFLLGADPFTSSSLANRTLLFDFGRQDWSDPLLAWSGLDKGKFGKIVPGGTVVGTVSDAVAKDLGLPRGVKLVAGGHDQCCNALGCGAIAPGTAVCGIGTYECLTPIFGKVDKAQMYAARLNIEDHVLPGMVVSFLYNQAGALVKWYRDTFAAADVAAGNTGYDHLTAEMPTEPTNLLVLPHFETVPWPRLITDTAGVIVGLHTSTTRGEILKAIIEGTAFHFCEALESLRNLGIAPTEFIAGGGGARSDAWLQIKADIFGIPFVRSKTPETGVAGAAMLAGIATGVLPSPAEAVHQFVKRDRAFTPDPTRHRFYQDQRRRFDRLYPVLRELMAQN